MNIGDGTWGHLHITATMFEQRTHETDRSIQESRGGTAWMGLCLNIYRCHATVRHCSSCASILRPTKWGLPFKNTWTQHAQHSATQIWAAVQISSPSRIFVGAKTTGCYVEKLRSFSCPLSGPHPSRHAYCVLASVPTRLGVLPGRRVIYQGTMYTPCPRQSRCRD